MILCSAAPPRPSPSRREGFKKNFPRLPEFFATVNFYELVKSTI